MSEYNDRIVAEFRANGGRATGYGRGLVLLHTVGARSGQQRVNPVAAIPEGDGWLIIASAAGAPTNPGWYFNLRSNPEVRIEVPGSGENSAPEELDVRAVELDGGEYEAAWQRFTQRSPAFSEYATRTQGRRMPIFRLQPRL